MATHVSLEAVLAGVAYLSRQLDTVSRAMSLASL